MKSQSFNWALGFVILSSAIEAVMGVSPVFAQQVHEPICYIQTADGQVVDLTHLCTRNAEASRTQPFSHQQLTRPVRRGRNAAHRSL
jgi:hypothetical protein